MMRLCKWATVIVLTLITILSLFPLSTTAASVTYYQTSKTNVPIWSDASSSSTKMMTIATKGTVLRVVGSTTNAAGNLWYRLQNGNWVYSKNVTKHSHSYTGGICTGNGCGYEWPYTVSSASGTYVVTESSGAKVWSRPYSNNSTHVRTAAYGYVLTITGKTENQAGNTWYRLSDGNWVFKGNVTRRFTVTYNANGGKAAISGQTVLETQSLKLASQKPTRVGYVFQGWATSASSKTVSYKAGSSYKFSKNITLYAVWKACSHSYVGGICSACKYEYPLSLSTYSATYVVTNSSGAKIWSRPYSNNSTHVRTAAKNAVLAVVAKTQNQVGNTWYKLSDGNWVHNDKIARRFTVTFNANGGKSAPSKQYALQNKALKITTKKPTRVGYIFQGWATSASSKTVSYKAGSSYKFSKNITLYAVWKACSHSYTGGICSTCKHEYPLSVSTHSATYLVTNSGGAKIWSRPYSNNSTHVRTATKNAVLSVVAKTQNQAGNTWYKLSDGNWVCKDGVTRCFAVKFNANGGKSAPSAQYALQNKALKITTKKPTRAGYVFQGWSTSASSKTVSYKAGASYKFTANKTLYAVWKVCSHTYNAKGICTSCKKEKPFEYKTITKRVYKVTASADTVPTYSRPFTGCSKVLNIKSGDLIQVVGVAKVDTKTWYQLSNDSWIQATYATHYGTYQNGAIVYSDSASAAKVTTVESISQNTTPAETYLKKNVGTIQTSGLIPGLIKTVTRTSNGKTVTTCKSMVPQGLTFADDYLLISAYCNCGAKHRSVIYVLDSSTRRYRTTLILDDYCHVGGLAKQGNYIWVCDSGIKTAPEQQLRSYAYADIKTAISVGANYWTLKAKTTPGVAVTPSYICSANGYVYVGTFHENSKTATIHYYSVSGSNIDHKGYFTVKGIKQIQGISIRGNYMVLSCSYGRENASKVYVFKDSKQFKTNKKVYTNKDATKYTFANMVEGCYIGSSNVYFLFESGAKTYRGSDNTRPLDKYVGFKKSTLGIK